MSKLVVVDGEKLVEARAQARHSYMRDFLTDKALNLKPLTEAQKRAGDEEKYTVVDREKLDWMMSDADTGQPNTDICPYAAHSQPRKCRTGEPNCLKCRLEWLTAEQEGE